MFTLPRGRKGLRKTPREVLSDLKSYKLYSDALTNTAVPLRYGWAGERGASTVFSEIFVCSNAQVTAFSFLYTMVNTVGASDDPLQPLWRSPDPRRSVLPSPVDFLALSKEIRPTDSLQTLPLDRSRRGGKRTLKPLRWVWCWEICGVAFLFVTFVWFGFISSPFFVPTQHDAAYVYARVSNLLFILLLLVFANVYCALLMQRWRAAWFISANDLYLVTLFLNVVLLEVKPWLLIYLTFRTMTCFKWRKKKFKKKWLIPNNYK